MSDETFDLPRATALLDRLIDGRTIAAQRAREAADNVRLNPRAFTDGAANEYDEDGDEWADEADTLRSIAARLLSAEQDRERLDWLLANTSSLRDWRWSGDFPNGRRNAIVDRVAIDEEIALDPPGKERWDWAARSSEGRDNG